MPRGMLGDQDFAPGPIVPGANGDFPPIAGEVTDQGPFDPPPGVRRG